MTCFANNLQLSSLVVHEAQIHHVVYDDSRSKTSRNDIDVYLSSLIEDLRKLWVDGVNVYDAHVGNTFLLRAMIFCTVNDFPTYGNLSGYSVKGHHACPFCEKNTSFIQLKHKKKTVYTPLTPKLIILL